MEYTAHVTDGAAFNPDATALLEIRATSVEEVLVVDGMDDETREVQQHTETVTHDHGTQARIDLFGFSWTHAAATEAVIDLGWIVTGDWKLVKDDGPRHWTAPVQPS